MLALAFNVGDLRLALPVSVVAEIMPRRELRPVALAPPGVVGLLSLGGTLTPVVDLCRLLLGRDCRPLRSSRLIVLSLPHGSGQRRVALVAENVLDLVPMGETLPGLAIAGAGWLGEHLADAPGLPQLMEPQQLMPDELAALYCEDAGAEGALQSLDLPS
jgi:chemotaxis-related protein WspB